MSELKAFEVTGKALFGRFFTKKVYDKSEADKVIESKDKEIAKLDRQIEFLKVTHDACGNCNKCADGMGKVFDKNLNELKAHKAQAEDDCAYWKMREGNAVNAMHETEEACMFLTKSERHQKYKRCLAMAKWCESEENRLEAIAPIFDTDKECWEFNSDYWYKCHKSWLKLAEKFKHNNEVNNG